MYVSCMTGSEQERGWTGVKNHLGLTSFGKSDPHLLFVRNFSTFFLKKWRLSQIRNSGEDSPAWACADSAIGNTFSVVSLNELSLNELSRRHWPGIMLELLGLLWWLALDFYNRIMFFISNKTNGNCFLFLWCWHDVCVSLHINGHADSELTIPQQWQRPIRFLTRKSWDRIMNFFRVKFYAASLRAKIKIGSYIKPTVTVTVGKYSLRTLRYYYRKGIVGGLRGCQIILPSSLWIPTELFCFCDLWIEYKSLSK